MFVEWGSTSQELTTICAFASVSTDERVSEVAIKKLNARKSASIFQLARPPQQMLQKQFNRIGIKKMRIFYYQRSSFMLQDSRVKYAISDHLLACDMLNKFSNLSLWFSTGNLPQRQSDGQPYPYIQIPIHLHRTP